MMLPTPPPNDAYLAQLVRALNLELRQRPRTIDGALTITPDQPLEVVATNGKRYRIGVNDTGAVTTTAVS